ncbi:MULTISPECIES: aminopeptidase N [Aliiglaciecola]|uniref:aminopeptidase N n=1 Tax=Aliiglaciecola TaxID=1406885 RepID=UPI001C0A00BF|nr:MULTISPECIES: aminopeptidase N [Aliiglaciecola]MBU2876299.1 aminopeptidase N [Aliiglaciecola lipolytica]MDO6710515.1 aminopeptidase N [Aliiglaciecola sp. 2_MG-2023]MDO6751620.1 aminopeptidase N [Aliiglaciecola sp. 1_MG-2023]
MSDNSVIKAKRRLDYQAPHFFISTVDLSVKLEEPKTQVKSQLRIKRNGEHQHPLVLDGEELELIDVKLNGKSVEKYQQTSTSLIIENVPEDFYLEIFTELNPAANSSLEGLYKTANAYCTQCEAEGFRKITYFIDRPDVLAEYTVTIYADQKNYPFLLSNGNKVDSGKLEDGRHWVKWHDPFKKPCYLFALVAGDFDLLEDHYKTASGRKILLQLFVDKGKSSRGHHALASLKKAMAWDEQVFDLEYDLDIYMIVAVDFFNMGAMENKGLNVFNSKYVLADSASATDEDFFNIESVIAHEYFHNWTGNRVTCRDWFQLSLKEGLTVFRDQQFSADMSSPVVNRIKNVKVMREHQFAEDASAMSHPIRPDEVIEMNNFYTVTVYDKGAEVIRMMHTLLGQEGFKNGIDLYFKRHDGQAVTCDDFVSAMQDANQVDLSQFKRWYGQSGTPIVNVTESFDAEKGEYALEFKQINNPTADQKDKQDLHIPIRLELITKGGETTVELFNLKLNQQSLVKSGFEQKPTVALLADFSAPVKLEFNYSVDALLQIALSSQDGFSRWDAAQTLFSEYLHGKTPASSKLSVNYKAIDKLVDGLLKDIKASSDLALIAEMLTLPSIETLAQQVPRYYVVELNQARKELEIYIAKTFSEYFATVYQTTQQSGYDYESEQVNKRKLRNLCLYYLAKTEQGNSLVTKQFESSDNMTDTLGALKAAQSAVLPCFEILMGKFEQKWSDDPLVLDKWFALHASCEVPDILARLDLLLSHKQFNHDNPNRVRSVIGTFAFYNATGFHAIDGSGYKYITDYLLKLDARNPQVAARIVTPLTQWRKMDDIRADLMKYQLTRLMALPNLSKDVFEKVSKSLSYQ